MTPSDMRSSKLSQWWRVAATGFGFLAFCVGGAVLGLMGVVLTLLRPVQQVRARIMRKLISYTFRSYLQMLRFLGLITFEVRNRHLIKPRGQLVIVNHPSLLDVCFVISLIEEADCIVKEALWRWPLTAAPVRAANYLKNNFDGLIERSLASLRAGSSLIIFPEGTRSPPGGLREFHRGASNIAIMSGQYITPVVITCYPATLLKTERWYQIPARVPHYVISVMPDLDVSSIINPEDLQSRSARKLNQYLQAYFAAAIASSEFDRG